MFFIERFLKDLSDLKHEFLGLIHSNDASMLTAVMGVSSRPHRILEVIDQVEDIITAGRKYLPEFYALLEKWDADHISLEIRKLQRDVDQLTVEIENIEPQSAGVVKMVKPLKEHHRLLQDMIGELEVILGRRKTTPSKQSAAEKVAARVESQMETVRLLERQRDEAKSKDPAHAEAIDRQYRKAIDAVMER